MKTVIYSSPHHKPHLVRWCGKTGFLGVGVQTFCGLQLGIEAGVCQVPDALPVCEVCQDNVNMVTDPH